MDIQALLPLLLNGNVGENADISKLLASVLSGEKDKSKIFKSIDPTTLFARQTQKGKSSKPCGLAPISEIAGNEVLGMLTRYFVS